MSISAQYVRLKEEQLNSIIADRTGTSLGHLFAENEKPPFDDEIAWPCHLYTQDKISRRRSSWRPRVF
jgi:hypothetical protein